MDLTPVGNAAAILAAAKAVEPYLLKVLGAPLDQIGELLASPFEEMKKRRAERFTKIVTDAAEQVRASGDEPIRIPDYIALPLLERATLVDDADLQRIWASLLANASRAGTGVHPGFVQVLENMGALDAVVLNEAYRRLLAQLKEKGNIQIVYLSEDQTNDVLRTVKENGGETCLDNLVRLRLLLPDPTHPNSFTTSEGLKMRPTFKYYLTRFGLEFYLACQPPVIRDKLIAESPSLASLTAYPIAPPY